MGLEVGSVSGRLGFKVDESGANRFERKLRDLRGKADRPITAEAKVDVDRRGFAEYDRQVKNVDRNHRDLVRGSGRLRTTLGSLWVGGAGVAAGAVAFGGLAAGVKSAFDQFKESERVGKQTNAVLKSTGGIAGVTAKQVGDLATAISNKTGVDDEAIQSGENLLLTFTNIRNETGKGNDIFNQATQTITDMSAALGQDTKSSAIQLGKALNDPIKGVTALQRVGVSFTASQKEQIKGLVEHGKTLDAQKLILRELNKEFGGSAAATATNSKRLSVTIGNLMETVGGAVSPVIERVAGGLNKFVQGMQAGTGAGGRFVTIAKNIGAAIAGTARFIGQAFGTISRAFSGGDKDATRLGSNIRRTFTAIVNTVRQTFAGVRNALRGIEPDLEIIGRRVAQLANLVITVFRRMLPYVKTVWTGIAQVIRGVVEVIAGLLTLNFGKVADGFKRILGGMLKAARGILGELTVPFRMALSAIGGIVSNGVTKAVGFFASLPGRAAKAISGLPGALAGVGRRAVSAFGSALAGLPGAIGNALKGGGSFLANIGRGIADWINAHTPFGDSIKVGPVKVHLPALAGGGKPGNVGPSHGGARAFIAGEGNLDEWVISQEGDRRSNIRWAREALESLTGRRVELHKGGKNARKAAKHPPKPILGDATNRGIKRSVARGEAGIKNFERDIQRLERHYGQVDREYGLSEEELTTELDDGSVVVNEDAVGTRTRELGGLHAIRERIRDKYKDYVKAVGEAVSKYQAAIDRLNKAIKAAKGKARGKERGKYVDERAKYVERIGELKDVASDLGLDLEDQRIDLEELEQESAAVSGTTGKAAPAPETSADTPDVGGDLGTGDTGGDTGGGDTTPTPPSAEEIAAAAIAQVTAFNAARSELFGNYGGNFVAAGANPYGSEVGQAAGMRYFGGAEGYAGGAGGGAPQVTQIISFPTPPNDPHSWTQASLYELQAAL